MFTLQVDFAMPEATVMNLFAFESISCGLRQMKHFKLSFYGPRFNAYTHVETENSSIVQIERSRINMQSSSHSSSGENQPLDENENAVRMQTELRLYP